MNKVRKFFVLVLLIVAQANALFCMDVHVAKRQKIEAPGTQSACKLSLKQADQLDHGLHCGYYALWNALCGVTPAFQDQTLDQAAFCELLEVWELAVGERRLPQEAAFVNIFRDSFQANEVNNLQVEELDLLVNNLVKNTLLPASDAPRAADDLQAANNVTVFASQNQIAQYATGHGLNPALLARIRKFRADGEPQAFIINTGNARDQKQVGTFHWIAAVLTRHPAPTEQFAYKLTFYDSGFVPKSSEDKAGFTQYSKKLPPMRDSIHALFIEEDLDLLTARSLLAPQLHAVKVYSDQLQDIKNAPGDLLRWSFDDYSHEYINFLEDYVRCCIRAVAQDRFNELNEKMALRRAKRTNNEYASFLRNKTIPVMQAELMNSFGDTNWTNFKELDVHIPTLQACARQLAINKLAGTYLQFVITGQITQDAFRQVAHEVGIPQEIIQAGVSQGVLPVVVEPGLVPMATE